MKFSKPNRCQNFMFSLCDGKSTVKVAQITQFRQNVRYRVLDNRRFFGGSATWQMFAGL